MNKRELKKTQKRLDSYKYPLKFKEDFKIESLGDIFNILSKKGGYNKKYLNKDTIYAGTRRIQCHSGAYRSCQDIYRIAKYYLPNIDYITVYNVFWKLNENSDIDVSYCSWVRKNVIERYNNNDFNECLDNLNLNFK